MTILDLSQMPTDDPIKAIMWLSGVQDAVRAELDAALQPAFYEARLQGPKRFAAAVAAGPTSMKRALAYTRHENRKRGQMVRWGDDLDVTSR